MVDQQSNQQNSSTTSLNKTWWKKDDYQLLITCGIIMAVSILMMVCVALLVWRKPRKKINLMQLTNAQVKEMKDRKITDQKT